MAKGNGITFDDLKFRLHELSPELLVTVEQASFVLNMSPSWLNHARSNGEPPPFVPMGGANTKKPAIRYRLGELLGYVKGLVSSSTIEAREKLAMSRIVDFEPWHKALHPFWVRGAFVVDSVFGEADFITNFKDPTTNIEWLSISKGLSKVWTDEGLRRMYCGQLLNKPNQDKSKLSQWKTEVEGKHQEFLARLNAEHWHSADELTAEKRVSLKGYHPDRIN